MRPTRPSSFTSRRIGSSSWGRASNCNDPDSCGRFENRSCKRPSVRCQTDRRPELDRLSNLYASRVSRLVKFGSKPCSARWFDSISRDWERPRGALRAFGRTQGSTPVRAGMIIMASLWMLFPAARAANISVDPLDTKPVVLALDDLRRAWTGQLNELVATARSLALADDTYEFVKRPNIPYVDAHYDPELLASERIDTVLIIDQHGKPLFWRRINQGD